MPPWTVARGERHLRALDFVYPCDICGLQVQVEYLCEFKNPDFSWTFEVCALHWFDTDLTVAMAEDGWLVAA